MHKFMTFVDGSNLYGAISNRLQIPNYQLLFNFIFRKAVKEWRSTFDSKVPSPAQHLRVYWYILGSIDEWDLSNDYTRSHLRQMFDNDRQIKELWTAKAKVMFDDRNRDFESKAFDLYLAGFTSWYNAKKAAIQQISDFGRTIESECDFVEIRNVGHWRIDPLRMGISEKGVDTSLAVDMVGMAKALDVAILISGDSDSIPSVSYLKDLGKQVAVVEFISGTPPERKGKGFSLKLRNAADFVVQVYDKELVSSKVAIYK